ncbi:Hachiman antiphage defense system protein HamA [Mesorhizobium sp.]|uniref:Hachiman antiphage defense system protein HamA n=1 Tax=Mesorhizobium sp. TaxID=1871066 RepID=UPI000FE2AD01|nr:Hachiman antiphage defense system protein HamA [Mesorhizobium sp.]RWG90560.1 MAG: DUF1837 domain-containing protein [Mesorhizobium sp.]RWK13563.1 MAG: DUF1837 domain-containing protein [Mesorhizobium sp.]
MVNPAHVAWLENTGDTFQTADGKTVEVWRLNHVADGAVLSDWARHFRQHYCTDGDLAALVEGTGLSNSQYLTQIKFPDAQTAPGPSTRSGDFGEILVADYIEYVLGYWCPRQVRYEDRYNRNAPTHGCDVMGFRFAGEEPGEPNDELFALEAKAGFGPTNDNRLQQAIDGSIKDLKREAMSLNAIKQRLRKVNLAQARAIQRFQNAADHPFVRKHGAAAILEDSVFTDMNLASSDASKHPNRDNLVLIVIRGEAMMQLVHALYQRAADEA